MSVLAVVLLGVLSVAAGLCLVRMGLGPSLLDRVVATDSILALVVTGLATSLAFGADSSVLAALIVVSLLGFVGSVAVARYVGGMLTEADSQAEADTEADPEPEAGAGAGEATSGAPGRRLPEATERHEEKQ